MLGTFANFIQRGQPWKYILFSFLGILVGISVLLYHIIPGRWGLIMLIALAGCFGLMIIGNLRKILLALIIIDIPLRWDIYLGARFVDYSLGNREGFLLSITTISLMVLLIIFVVKELIKPGSQIKISIFENVPLVAYLFISILSTIVARDKYGSLFQIFFLFQMFFVYAYVAIVVQTRKDVLYIVFFLMVGLIVEGTIILMQKFLGFSINFAGITTVNDFGRLAGTLGSPNIAASFFSLLLATALGLFLNKENPGLRWVALVGFVLGSAGLALTISRGGILAYLISIAILGGILWMKGKIPGWVIATALIVGVAVAVLYGGQIINRVYGLREDAAIARVSLMEIAWRMILDHPWLGVGLNNYAIHIREYVYSEAGIQFLYVVHNKYLLIWAETGLFGLLAYIGFLITGIRRGWRTWKRDQGVISLLAIAFVAGMIGQMIHMTVEIFDSRSQVQALWLVAGLLTAMDRISRSEKND